MRYAAIGAVVTAILGGSSLPLGGAVAEAGEYDPVIKAEDFLPQVNNRYFTLKPGTRFTYEKRTKRETERIEVVVGRETRTVLGVTTTVVRDRVWLNSQLSEETRSWYAQDKDGNVWFFGEAVDNYARGRLQDHDGSWEAGVAGAKPGLVMLKDPKPGVTYRQAYRKGETEDMGTVLSIGKQVKVPYGAFEDCVQIRDWSRIDKTASEYKYYCPGAGIDVLSESALTGVEESELISVSAEPPGTEKPTVQ